MKPLKISMTFAISMVGGLLIILLFTVSPMEQRYQDCLQQISSQTGMEQEAILEHYPELKIAKGNYAKVQSLRAEIEAMKGGPAPMVSKEQYQSIQQKQAQIKELQQQNDHIFESIEVIMAGLP